MAGVMGVEVWERVVHNVAVALRCGGFEHLRRVSPSIRDFAWQRQHTFQGEPH
jgi:hypothetical protein